MDALVEAAAAALAREERRRARERSAYGIDSLCEVEMHPLLREGFKRAGLGVHPEQLYPSLVLGEESRRRTRRSERERCDLVLTADRTVRLVDPVEALLAAEREAQEAAGTLFASAGRRAGTKTRGARAKFPVIGPDGAFWAEVKLVGQFTYTHGVPLPNRTYTAELLQSAAADLAKLGRDSLIIHGGLLLVMFNSDEETAAHDLRQFSNRCLDRGVLGSLPVTRRVRVPDRIGNTVCTVSMLAARRMG